MSRSTSPAAWLIASWWLLFPFFAALTSWLAVERGCGDPYNLLPGLMSTPWSAWPIAVVYVGSHLWLLAAYLLTISRTGKLVFHVREAGGVWGADAAKPVLMTAALVIEYAPGSFWRLLGAGFGCTL